MNKHSIIATPQIAETAPVSAAYDALEKAHQDAETALSLMNDAFGSLCESEDFIPADPTDEERWASHSKYLEKLATIKRKKLEREHRRITYYGCKLRLLSCISEMSRSRKTLIEAVNALRNVTESITDKELRLQAESARCNIVFAEFLLSTTYTAERVLHKASGYYHAVSEVWKDGHNIDLEASLKAEIDRCRREWVVMSSGHGSAFRFDGGDGNQVPEGPYLSFDEAVGEGIAWELISDTIGGRAQLYNVRTNKTVGDF